MSTGTPNEPAIHPDLTLDEYNDYESVVEDTQTEGYEWAERDAGKLERMAIWDVVTGVRPRPNFSNCQTGVAAVHELVRCIHPPCGLHLDSAVQYWESIHGGYFDSPFLVEAFFRGAFWAIDERVQLGALDSARRWVEQRYSSNRLEPVRQFVEQYGDTWQDNPPPGCNSVFDTALYMAGRSDSVRPGFAESAYSREFGVRNEFASDTEEYARRLIRAVVARLRYQHPPSGGDRFHGEALPRSESGSPLSERRFRGIRLGRRQRQAEGESDSGPRPRDEQSDG